MYEHSTALCLTLLVSLGCGASGSRACSRFCRILLSWLLHCSCTLLLDIALAHCSATLPKYIALVHCSSTLLCYIALLHCSCTLHRAPDSAAAFYFCLRSNSSLIQIHSTLVLLHCTLKFSVLYTFCICRVGS